MYGKRHQCVLPLSVWGLERGIRRSLRDMKSRICFPFSLSAVGREYN